MRPRSHTPPTKGYSAPFGGRVENTEGGEKGKEKESNPFTFQDMSHLIRFDQGAGNLWLRPGNDPTCRVRSGASRTRRDAAKAPASNQAARSDGAVAMEPWTRSLEEGFRR